MKKIDISKIAKVFRDNIEEIEFAYIFGSSKNGYIKTDSDLDIAIYLDKNYKLDENLISNIYETFEKCYSDIKLDITILNNASIILQFEALTGRRLFVRSKSLEEYLNFFSLTAREYESEMFWRNKQLKYRGYG